MGGAVDGLDFGDTSGDCSTLPTEDGAGFGSCWDGVDNNPGNGFDGTDTQCTYGGGWGLHPTGFLDFRHDAVNIMHELGHLLGLGHGGPWTVSGLPNPQAEINCKPQYISVMNYQHSGLPGIFQGINLGLGETTPPPTCADGLDNDGNTLIDENDWLNCRWHADLIDLDGDGVVDPFIVDYSPPRFPSGGERPSRSVVLSGLVLTESALDESVILDPFDSFNTAWFSNPNSPTFDAQFSFPGSPFAVPMGLFNTRVDGYNMYVSEDGMSGRAECHDSRDNDVDTLTDVDDGNCIGYDFDGDGNITPGAVVASSVNSILGGCDGTNNAGEVLIGANDWIAIGLPASGPGAPETRDVGWEPYGVDPEDVRAVLTAADLELRFGAEQLSAVLGEELFLSAQLRNRGPNPALGASVSFGVTPGVELVGASTICTIVAGSATCNVGNLAPGQILFIDLVLRLTPGTPAAVRGIEGVASTPGDLDPLLDNNVDSVLLVPEGTCDATVYEAEAMSGSGTVPVAGGVKLSTAGHISTGHVFAEHSTIVTVRAKGQKSGFVWPKMTLSVGGVAIAQRSVSSSVYEDYVFELEPEAAELELRVTFDNPAGAGDRFLFLDRVSVACAPSCEDGLLNQDESDVDCGGSCGPTCEDGEDCQYDEDCFGGYCDGMACATPSCTDGVENGHEEGVDCGGTCPEECPRCNPPVTYQAEVMNRSSGSAVAEGWALWSTGHVSTSHNFTGEAVRITVRAKGDPSLGIWPRMVVTVDGNHVGTTYATSNAWTDYFFDALPAAGTRDLRIAFDNDHYAPPHHDRNLYLDRVTIACAPTCSDFVLNGDESDIDCGGGECPPCADGKSCGAPSDCESNNCQNAACASPSTFEYDFESGIAGWTNMDWPATATSSASSPVFSGSKALKVTVNSTGAGAPRVWVVPGPSPVAGTTVTFRVYFPAGAPIYAAQPYVADVNWSWHHSWNATPATGSWRTLTVQLPANFTGPAREIGIKVYLNGNVTTYNGAFYVDQVEW